MRRRKAHRTPSELTWDSRAKWWPHRERLGERDSNLWMLAEDVGNQIWAHFHRLEENYHHFDPEPLQLDGCSDGLRDILIESVPYNEYEQNLSGAVMNFVKMVAQQFVYDGCMPFEVSGGWDASGTTRRLEQARLEYVYPDSIVRLGGQVFQVVPPDSADGSEDGAGSRIIRLDPRRIVTFRPPPRYRGPLAGIRAGFPEIGQSQHKWMMGAVSGKPAEDFKTVTRSYSIRLARLSAPIGWNGRGLWHDHVAEFHWMCRELQWQRFCIEVRDAILQTLARVFKMIGSWRREQPRLVWDHLPTVEQVQTAESQIMTEGSRFNEVLKPFRLRS